MPGGGHSAARSLHQEITECEQRRRQPVEHGQPLLLDGGGGWGVEFRFAAEERAHRRRRRLTETARGAGAIQREGWTQGRWSRPLLHPLLDKRRRRRRPILLQHLLLIVDEVASGAVRTEADRVVRATQFRFVFRMSRQAPQFLDTVRELTLIPVFAHTELLVGATELRLVPGSVDGGGCSHCGRRRGWGRLRPFQSSVLLG